MELLWFWLLVLLAIIAIAAWPTWPHTRDRWIYRHGTGWSHAPAFAAIALIAFILILGWFGVIFIRVPWIAAY